MPCKEEPLPAATAPPVSGLPGGIAGNIEVHNDQYLHQDKIAELEFALEAMICGLHEVHATRTPLAGAHARKLR
jgi:hypothetical protein